MVQLPTGAGKTFIAGELLSSLLEGRKAVWLTHRKELADQTKQMLSESAVPASADINWQPGRRAPTIAGGVCILMAQTLSRRVKQDDIWADYTSEDIMIIDEAHHAAAEGYSMAMRLWQGPVIGLTATPWRLSKKEGFDHLFEQLICGPQVPDLQNGGYLCKVRVLSPSEEGRILGGYVDRTGDFSETGIESANASSDIWTAGAVEFWRKHGEYRQTVVYAVSTGHARNLLQVFRDQGVAASLILGETETSIRSSIIRDFKSGHIKVIVNVAVATEGFDLPDAGCVLITRPTLSVALYLQMMGRGMRPKSDGSDCLVLDMAGNTARHGLPGGYREWSLKPRGEEEPPLGLPTVWCPHCEQFSMFGLHNCEHCGEPFGQLCARCVKWRPWTEWSLSASCKEDHDPVCDRCHYDAHLRANLPVTPELRLLSHHEFDVDPLGKSNPLTVSESRPTEMGRLSQQNSDEMLDPERAPFLRDLLIEERGQVVGAEPDRIQQLRQLVAMRKLLLADDSQMWQKWSDHLAKTGERQDLLSYAERSRRFTEWEAALKKEKETWEQELAAFESTPVDKGRIYSNAVERVLNLLEAEARAAGLLPDEPDQPVGATIRPPQPAPVGQAVSKSPRRSNKSNKGYRHPETGETWKLEDAFFAVATEEQKRQDVENRRNPYPNSSGKMFSYRKKVVVRWGFIPN